MKYFITYQQFGGGAQAIHNQIIEIHPSVWAEKLNSAYKGSPSSGRYVILFYHELGPHFNGDKGDPSSEASKFNDPDVSAKILTDFEIYFRELPRKYQDPLIDELIRLRKP